MNNRWITLSIVLTSLLLMLGNQLPSGKLTTEPISEATFKDPPHAAKPKTWFHAMSANMSKKGLTKDLEAMSRVGIGGLLLFNVTQGIPMGEFWMNRPINMAASEVQSIFLIIIFSGRKMYWIITQILILLISKRFYHHLLHHASIRKSAVICI